MKPAVRSAAPRENEQGDESLERRSSGSILPLRNCDSQSPWIRVLALTSTLVACKPCPPKPHFGGPEKATNPTEYQTQDWRYETPKPNLPSRFGYLQHNEFKFPNGLTLLALPRASRIVTLSLVVRLPPDDLEHAGRTALTARLLTEGTQLHPGFSLAEAAENLGTELHSSADRDSATLSMTVLAPDIEASAALLFDAIQHPEFSTESFDAVRNQWLGALKSSQDDPSTLAEIVGMRELWGNTLGAPVDGTVGSIMRLTAAEIAAVHAERFVPENSALVVVGGFDENSLRELVSPFATAWRSSATATIAPAPSPPAEGAQRIVYVRRETAIQTAILVAQAFPPRTVEGHETRLLLNTILGGMFTSRLNQNLREQHAYTYGAFSNIVATNEIGAWLASTSVETGHTIEALRQILRERDYIGWSKKQRPVSPDELERARASLLGRVGAHLQDTEQVASDLSELFVGRLKRNYYADYGARLDRVTVAELISAGRQWFRTPPPVIVLVGDTSGLESELGDDGFSYSAADTRWLE